MNNYKYPEIVAFYEKEINEKRIKPGEKLPTEKEITEFFQVSRMTVRRAYDELIHKGLAIRKPGKGVIAAVYKSSRDVEHISIRQDEQLKKQYTEFCVKVLDFRLEQVPYQIEQLFTEPKECFVYDRIQYGDGQPLVYENLYFPKIDYPNMKIEYGYLYTSLMQLKTHREISTRVLKIEVEAQIANDYIAQLLEIPKHSAVLVMNVLIGDQNNQPLMASQNYYPADKFKYIYHKE